MLAAKKESGEKQSKEEEEMKAKEEEQEKMDLEQPAREVCPAGDLDGADRTKHLDTLEDILASGGNGGGDDGGGDDLEEGEVEDSDEELSVVKLVNRNEQRERQTVPIGGSKLSDSDRYRFRVSVGARAKKNSLPPKCSTLSRCFQFCWARGAPVPTRPPWDEARIRFQARGQQGQKERQARCGKEGEEKN